MIENKRETQGFKKDEIENLSKLRIIKKNLVHVHGFPKIIVKTDTLKSKEYFGLYGKITKIIMTYKINPNNSKKVYSAYITYSNDKEAAYAILCVDSLLIQGKIIRAFFGTTKYCNYFINNQVCPNFDKCIFLHQLINEEDIIIDNNLIFSYNDHISLAKKIINYTDPKTKALILKMPKPKNIIFPFLDFIYLSEKEKEKYFTSGIISYFGTNPRESKDNCINNDDESKSQFESFNNYINNFQLNNIKMHKFINTNNNCKNLLLNEKNIIISNNSYESDKFHNLIDNPIKHIFAAKPFYSKIKNFPLKRVELEFFKRTLEKNNQDFGILFEGCLDCLSDVI